MTLEQLKKIVTLFPDDAIGHYSLGFKYIEMEKRQLAKEHLEKAHALDPNHIATYLSLGNLYADMGLFELAKDMYLQGLKVIPNLKQGQGQDLQPDLEAALEEISSF
jgi:tetratricopeptide (TPR) repeat protein